MMWKSELKNANELVGKISSKKEDGWDVEGSANMSRTILATPSNGGDDAPMSGTTVGMRNRVGKSNEFLVSTSSSAAGETGSDDAPNENLQQRKKMDGPTVCQPYDLVIDSNSSAANQKNPDAITMRFESDRNSRPLPPSFPANSTWEDQGIQIAEYQVESLAELVEFRCSEGKSELDAILAELRRATKSQLHLIPRSGEHLIKDDSDTDLNEQEKKHEGHFCSKINCLLNRPTNTGTSNVMRKNPHCLQPSSLSLPRSSTVLVVERDKVKEVRRRHIGLHPARRRSPTQDIELEYEYFYDFSRKELRDIEEALGGSQEATTEEDPEGGGRKYEMEDAVSPFRRPPTLTSIFHVCPRQNLNDLDPHNDNGTSGKEDPTDPLQSAHHQREYDQALELIALATQLPFRDEPSGTVITPAFAVSNDEIFLDVLTLVEREMRAQGIYPGSTSTITPSTTTAKENKVMRISEAVENKSEESFEDPLPFSSDIQQSQEKPRPRDEQESGREEEVKEHVGNSLLLRCTAELANGRTTPEMTTENGPSLMERDTITVGPFPHGPLSQSSTSSSSNSTPSNPGLQDGPPASPPGFLTTTTTTLKMSQSTSQMYPGGMSDSIPRGNAYSGSHLPISLPDRSGGPGCGLGGNLIEFYSVLDPTCLEQMFVSGSRRSSLPRSPSEDFTEKESDSRRRRSEELCFTPSAYVQARMSRSRENEEGGSSDLWESHTGINVGGTMTDEHVSDSVKLENIRIRPESVHRMLQLQEEIMLGRDKHGDRNRFNAFDLVELDYGGMEQYLKFLLFHSLLLAEEARKAPAPHNENSGSSVTRIPLSFEEELVRGDVAYVEDPNVGDYKQVFMKGSWIRLRNFVVGLIRSRCLSVSSFCLGQQKRKGKILVRPAKEEKHTGATTSAVSTPGNEYISGSGSELHCEIEGGRFTGSDFPGSSHKLRTVPLEWTGAASPVGIGDSIAVSRSSAAPRRGYGVKDSGQGSSNVGCTSNVPTECMRMMMGVSSGPVSPEQPTTRPCVFYSAHLPTSHNAQWPPSDCHLRKKRPDVHFSKSDSGKDGRINKGELMARSLSFCSFGMSLCELAQDSAIPHQKDDDNNESDNKAAS